MTTLARLDAEIEAVIGQAHALASGLTDAEFNQPPAGGGWSIAQCLAHLTLTFEHFEPRFIEAIHAARARNLTGAEPFRYSLLERLAIQHVEPPPSLKVKAPANFVLHEPRPAGPVLAGFEAAHRRFQAALASSNGLDLSRVRISHPAIPFWKQRLGAAFIILAGHCRRHLWQARRVREELAAPFASPFV